MDALFDELATGKGIRPLLDFAFSTNCCRSATWSIGALVPNWFPADLYGRLNIWPRTKQHTDEPVNSTYPVAAVVAGIADETALVSNA